MCEETPGAAKDSIYLIIWKFFIHLLFGSALFCSLLVPIVLLNTAVHHLTNYNVDKPLIYMVTGVEYFIALVDFIVYIIFVMREAVNLVRAIWRHR